MKFADRVIDKILTSPPPSDGDYFNLDIHFPYYDSKARLIVIIEEEATFEGNVRELLDKDFLNSIKIRAKNDILEFYAIGLTQLGVKFEKDFEDAEVIVDFNIEFREKYIVVRYAVSISVDVLLDGIKKAAVELLPEGVRDFLGLGEDEVKKVTFKGPSYKQDIRALSTAVKENLPKDERIQEFLGFDLSSFSANFDVELEAGNLISFLDKLNILINLNMTLEEISIEATEIEIAFSSDFFDVWYVARIDEDGVRNYFDIGFSFFNVDGSVTHDDTTNKLLYNSHSILSAIRGKNSNKLSGLLQTSILERLSEELKVGGARKSRFNKLKGLLTNAKDAVGKFDSSKSYAKSVDENTSTSKTTNEKSHEDSLIKSTEFIDSLASKREQERYNIQDKIIQELCDNKEEFFEGIRTPREFYKFVLNRINIGDLTLSSVSRLREGFTRDRIKFIVCDAFTAEAKVGDIREIHNSLKENMSDEENEEIELELKKIERGDAPRSAKQKKIVDQMASSVGDSLCDATIDYFNIDIGAFIDSLNFDFDLDLGKLDIGLALGLPPVDLDPPIFSLPDNLPTDDLLGEISSFLSNAIVNLASFSITWPMFNTLERYKKEKCIEMGPTAGKIGAINNNALLKKGIETEKEMQSFLQEVFNEKDNIKQTVDSVKQELADLSSILSPGELLSLYSGEADQRTKRVANTFVQKKSGLLGDKFKKEKELQRFLKQFSKFVDLDLLKSVDSFDDNKFSNFEDLCDVINGDAREEIGRLIRSGASEEDAKKIVGKRNDLVDRLLAQSVKIPGSDNNINERLPLSVTKDGQIAKEDGLERDERLHGPYNDLVLNSSLTILEPAVVSYNLSIESFPIIQVDIIDKLPLINNNGQRKRLLFTIPDFNIVSADITLTYDLLKDGERLRAFGTLGSNVPGSRLLDNIEKSLPDIQATSGLYDFITKNYGKLETDKSFHEEVFANYAVSRIKKKGFDITGNIKNDILNSTDMMKSTLPIEERKTLYDSITLLMFSFLSELLFENVKVLEDLNLNYKDISLFFGRRGEEIFEKTKSVYLENYFDESYEVREEAQNEAFRQQSISSLVRLHVIEYVLLNLSLYERLELQTLLQSETAKEMISQLVLSNILKSKQIAPVFSKQLDENIKQSVDDEVGFVGEKLSVILQRNGFELQQDEKKHILNEFLKRIKNMDLSEEYLPTGAQNRFFDSTFSPDKTGNGFIKDNDYFKNDYGFFILEPYMRIDDEVVNEKYIALMNLHEDAQLSDLFEQVSLGLRLVYVFPIVGDLQEGVNKKLLSEGVFFNDEKLKKEKAFIHREKVVVRAGRTAYNDKDKFPAVLSIPLVEQEQVYSLDKKVRELLDEYAKKEFVDKHKEEMLLNNNFLALFEFCFPLERYAFFMSLYSVFTTLNKAEETGFRNMFDTEKIYLDSILDAVERENREKYEFQPTQNRNVGESYDVAFDEARKGKKTLREVKEKGHIHPIPPILIDGGFTEPAATKEEERL